MIYLSAGHHDKDPGAVANGYKEADLTKEARNTIALRCNPKSLILDKDWETNPQYQGRIKPGDGSVLFDIHFNSASATATGTECYVRAIDFQNKNSLSYKMAAEICELTSKILRVPNRGVKPDNQSQHSRIGILHKGAGVSVLWEICFISNTMNMNSYKAKKEEVLKMVAEILQKYDAIR